MTTAQVDTLPAAPSLFAQLTERDGRIEAIVVAHLVNVGPLYQLMLQLGIGIPIAPAAVTRFEARHPPGPARLTSRGASEGRPQCV